jgi:curved DNA-binding protein CbpA
MVVDHYKELGVDPQAEDIVIRAAYRALAQRYHPDKLAVSQSKSLGDRTMASIQAAYDTLSDPSKRAAYDGTRSTINLNENTLTNFKNPLETEAWHALLNSYPLLERQLLDLKQKDILLANAYKNLMLEFIAENIVTKMINKISAEIKDYLDIDENN